MKIRFRKVKPFQGNFTCCQCDCQAHGLVNDCVQVTWCTSPGQEAVGYLCQRCVRSMSAVLQIHAVTEFRDCQHLVLCAYDVEEDSFGMNPQPGARDGPRNSSLQEDVKEDARESDSTVARAWLDIQQQERDHLLSLQSECTAPHQLLAVGKSCHRCGLIRNAAHVFETPESLHEVTPVDLLTSADMGREDHVTPGSEGRDT